MSKIIEPRNVIILGSLPSEKDTNKELFNTITKCCEKKNLSSYNPLDLKWIKFEDKDLFNFVKIAITKSDFLIVDISSTQQDINMWIWILVWTANFLHKSIIIVAKTQTNVSRTLKWLPNVSRVIFYENMKDLEEKLDDYLNYWNFKK